MTQPPVTLVTSEIPLPMLQCTCLAKTNANVFCWATAYLLTGTGRLLSVSGNVGMSLARQNLSSRPVPFGETDMRTPTKKIAKVSPEEQIANEGRRAAAAITVQLYDLLKWSPDGKKRYFPPIDPAVFTTNEIELARRRIFERDDYTCIYCGASVDSHPGLPLHVDHIDPVQLGGPDAAINLVTSCMSCNCSKGPRRLPEPKRTEIFREVFRRNEAHGIPQREWFHELGLYRRREKVK